MVAPDKDEAGARSRLFAVATAVLVVFGVAVLAWLARPFDDSVPLVVPDSLPADTDPASLPRSAQFRCSAVLGDGGPADPSEQAVDALAIQDLSREPCVDVRRQHRLLGILDMVLVGAGLLSVAAISVRTRRRAREETARTAGAGVDEPPRVDSQQPEVVG